MYELKPISARNEHLHQRIRDRVIQVDSETAMTITTADRKYRNVPPVILSAMYIKALCENKTIRIEDEECIVGNTSKNFCGASVYPQWMGEGWACRYIDDGVWTPREDGLYHNPDGEELKLSMAPEDYENLCSIKEYWGHNRLTRLVDDWLPEGYAEFADLLCSQSGVGTPQFTLPSGHLTAGYKKIVDRGYASVQKEARDWLDAHKANMMGEDAQKAAFYTAAEIVCKSATLMIRRYAKACLDKAAQTADPARKAELKSMADGLNWISENPARTFREACQAAYLYQLLLLMSYLPDNGSFGRVDQYTWPYLKKDLEEGRLTMDEAREIMDCFFLKINSLYWGAQPHLVSLMGKGNTYLHITVGGVDPDTGEDASNPVTLMVMEAIGRLHLHDPATSLRINKNTPPEVWECAITTNRLVGGLPLFQNDEVIIPGLMKELGFTLHDARDYAIIGCQEITGSGTDYPAACGSVPPHNTIHEGVALVMAINNGVNSFNNSQCPIQKGYLYEMKDIEEVKAAFRETLEYLIRAQVSFNNYFEATAIPQAPNPMLSISMDGCMEQGKDATQGGCKYNSYGGTATGLATIADSLCAIEYMCFDKKLCTTRELYDAVMANWEGYEELHQMVLNLVPHFGNGDPYADRFLDWVTSNYYNCCKQCYSVRAKVFKAGMYGATDHIGQGKRTWATPDGRKTGDSLADGCSPCQSRDKKGPTNVFNSELIFDQSRFMDGIALNVRFHPSVLDREDGLEKLRDMTKAYFEDGGMAVQYNIVSTETMRAAQENPEAYRDLVVRIAGYSAYFVELSKDCQNDVIARNENRL